MGWKMITGGNIVTLTKPGMSLEGKFLGGRPAGDKGSTLYSYQDLKTKEVKSFWGSAQLDDRLAQVKDNEIFKVTFKGKQKTSKGFMCKVFDVEVKE